MNDTDILHELVAEIRGLRADLAQRAPRRADDTAGLLLAAIAFAVGDRVFSAVELSDHAGLPKYAALRAALDAAGAHTPHRLGRYLRRIEGRACGGFVVHAVVRDRYGWIWKIVTMENAP